jgi:CDP-diacylglycerol--glycerol-3-phosphate 3-phosphatidyltransferase
MLDMRARSGLSRILDPIARVLARLGIRPWMVTILGLAVTLAGAWLIAIGELAWGAGIAGGGALLDVLDGPVARVTGTASKRGAFLDTVSDRIGEVGLWIGTGYYVAPDQAQVALCVTALGLSMLVPFIRSKAEGWGLEGKGGIMGKAERNVLMLLGVGFEGLGFSTLLPMLWIYVALTALTVAQRCYRTWVQLGA